MPTFTSSAAWLLAISLALPAAASAAPPRRQAGARQARRLARQAGACARG